MYHVSAQGVDERMINVRYYYYIAKHCNSILVGFKIFLKQTKKDE